MSLVVMVTTHLQHRLTCWMMDNLYWTPGVFRAFPVGMCGGTGRSSDENTLDVKLLLNLPQLLQTKHILVLIFI